MTPGLSPRTPLLRTPPSRSRAVRAACALLAAAALGSGLAGCFPLVVGGVAVGSLMVADRRTAGTQVEDEGIELQTVNRIYKELGDQPHVNVTSYNRVVLLSGEVPRADLLAAVEGMAKASGNVRSVVNELVVAPNSTLSQRSSDTFITGKVRASLVDAKDLSASAFKVVTERGVVYLLGTVSEREANRATSIARGVDGVRKVVRVFELLSEEELVRLGAPRPAPVSGDAAGAAAAPAQTSTPASTSAPAGTPATVLPPAAAPASVATPTPLPPLAPAGASAPASAGVVTSPVTTSPLR